MMASPQYRAQSDGPAGGKAAELRKLIYGYRAAAHDKLVADSPELQAQLARKTKERADALRPSGRPAAVGAPAGQVGSAVQSFIDSISGR